ncbi:MAG TPA: ABC transporter ATP-binding protein [Thermoanaerobaculia bacterium]|jgi:lipopolysaccharide transport system ATP-binding protein|nr:ABC transporter ATP-binding protein [Thermoanaerobaculia bacterium]
MTDLAVLADRVSKTYRVYGSAGERLRELVFRRPRHREFHALSDVSFELSRGQALGLIGENGAGKSTLLKIVAGTTRATSGFVERVGTVASILELGMGFHPDFTGRENARMNAALLGLNGPEIRRRLPEIRDFAELGEFFDRPVRTYSSGMVLRLAFAVATHADADVLIVDEALAVGDGYFQKKSVDRITEFHRRGGSLLFCSHALYYVALLCDAAIWLKNGAVAGQGAALPVVRGYEAFLQEKEQSLAHAELAAPSAAPVSGTDGHRPARLTEVFLHDGSGYPRTEFAAGETLAVEIEFETDDPSLAFHLRIGVDREDGVQAFAMDTRHEPWAPLTGRRRYRLRLVIPELPVAQGDFRVYAYLGDEKALHVHDIRILKPGFSVASREYVVGLVAPRHLWTVPDAEAAAPARDAAGVAASS